MKIALVRTASNILTLGSYNIQEIGLAEALLEHGVSADIYARFSNVDEPTVVARNGDCRVEIHPLKGSRIYREIMYYPTLKQELLGGGYDLVQCLDDSQMMLPGIFKALKKSGIPTVLWQGMYRNFAAAPARLMQMAYDAMFARSLDRNTDLKIAKTHDAAEYLRHKHYHDIHTIPVGLVPSPRTDDAGLRSRIADFKRQWPHLLLYIGAIEQRRNPMFMLDLLEQLPADTGLMLVGRGPMLAEVKEEIARRSLQQRVLQTDRVDNDKTHLLFDAADILLLPTAYEIYGMVLMEALQAGIPALATPEAGPRAILTHEVLGKCLPLDAGKWAEAVAFYRHNHNSEADCDERAMAVESRHRWGSIAREFWQCYSKLLDK